MRLIDADALKDMMIQAYNDALPDFSVPWQRELAHNVTISLMADIDETPTVDAVPVVRCKDCANYAGNGMYCAWDLLTGDMGYCHHGYVADRPATEETGADGERKGGDE